jgi:hypothetical protein
LPLSSRASSPRLTRENRYANEAEAHIAKPNVKEAAVALIKETFQIRCEGTKLDESGN